MTLYNFQEKMRQHTVSMPKEALVVFLLLQMLLQGYVRRMQEATLKGDYSLALELQDKLMPLHKAIFTEPGLVGAKYAMSKLGLCKDEVRLPLTPLSEPTKQKINSALKHADLI